MDERTYQAYVRHADELATRDHSIPSPVARYFDVAFPARGTSPRRVLDVGAGSGRDLRALLAAKIDAYGIEPVAELRQAAVAREPELAYRLSEGRLPGLSVSPDRRYDGVLCSAVLQHLPRAQLFDAVLELREVLVDDGRALVAIPAERPGLSADHRDELGRLFQPITPDELQLLFERIGFACLARWQDDDGLRRPGHRWVTMLFQVRASSGSRAIDQVATVISQRERKSATYKLALLRALADIALTEARVVRWRDPWVAVPIDRIAERWIRYYWPIFKSPTLLPQLGGDQAAGQHKLGFARPLDELIRHYDRRGGLAAYLEESRGTLSSPGGALHRKLMSALRRTIKEGPVTYAGGALSGRLFGYEDENHLVLVPSPLWRELSLLGHWIGDSIVLRWAELTARLSGDKRTSAEVVPYLLVEPPGDRDQSFVSKIYQARTDVRCVWTDQRIGRSQLAIDHVLPWSLWHNNDLWNLVPSLSKVNASKSDLLPSRRLLRDRRGAFFDAWAITHAAAPERFVREAEHQLGCRVSGTSFFEPLFDVMSESVESTRLQRGIAGWEP